MPQQILRRSSKTSKICITESQAQSSALLRHAEKRLKTQKKTDHFFSFKYFKFCVRGFVEGFEESFLIQLICARF